MAAASGDFSAALHHLGRLELPRWAGPPPSTGWKPRPGRGTELGCGGPMTSKLRHRYRGGLGRGCGGPWSRLDQRGVRGGGGLPPGARIHEADPRPFDQARTRLAYGELLRRSGRRVDSRALLRTALETLDRLGAGAWADRAQRALRASGESARRRDPSTVLTLTAQEQQVAQLVKQGLSNRDVAARLYVSPRTVEYHLERVPEAGRSLPR